MTTAWREEIGSNDMTDENDLLILEVCNATETYVDVKYWKQLTDVQLAEAKALVHEFKETVTDLPGNTDLVQHEVKLTSD